MQIAEAFVRFRRELSATQQAFALQARKLADSTMHARGNQLI